MGQPGGFGVVDEAAHLVDAATAGDTDDLHVFAETFGGFVDVGCLGPAGRAPRRPEPQHRVAAGKRCTVEHGIDGCGRSEHRGERGGVVTCGGFVGAGGRYRRRRVLGCRVGGCDRRAVRCVASPACGEHDRSRGERDRGSGVSRTSEMGHVGWNTVRADHHSAILVCCREAWRASSGFSKYGNLTPPTPPSRPTPYRSRGGGSADRCVVRRGRVRVRHGRRRSR